MLAGDNFGKYGNGYVRLSYVNSLDNINLAIKNLKTALENENKSSWLHSWIYSR